MTIKAEIMQGRKNLYILGLLKTFFSAFGQRDPEFHFALGPENCSQF